MLKIKTITTIIMILMTMPFLLGFTYQPFAIKDASHEIANLARSIGLPENNPIIVEAKKMWIEADKQFKKDRDIIATVVYNEAGYGCSDRHMELVAAIIYNRLKSDDFPDTVYEIVTAPKQYHPLYADPKSLYGELARKSDKWQKCQRIATKALKGEIECPDNVFYQSNYILGSKIYEIHYTSYSITYFCYEYIWY